MGDARRLFTRTILSIQGSEERVRGREGPRGKVLHIERMGCMQIPERPQEAKRTVESRWSMTSDEAGNLYEGRTT